MKRFYCTVCGRVKRVRALPNNVQSVNSMTPNKRVGTCDKHYVEHEGYVPVSVRLANLKNLKKAN